MMNFIHEYNRVYYRNESGDVLAEVLFPNIDAETAEKSRFVKVFFQDVSNRQRIGIKNS